MSIYCFNPFLINESANPKSLKTIKKKQFENLKIQLKSSDLRLTLSLSVLKKTNNNY